MKKILIIFLILFSYKSFSQKLELLAISKSESAINVRLSLTNNTDKKIIFYKPKKLDFCNGILNLVFESNTEEIDYNPCEEVRQLDAIILSCNNTIGLDSRESLIFSYKLDYHEYFKKVHKLKFQMNLEDVNFVNKDEIFLQEIFKENLETEFFNFKI